VQIIRFPPYTPEPNQTQPNRTRSKASGTAYGQAMNLSLPKPLLHSENAPDEFATTAVVFNSIPSDLGSSLQC